LTGNGIPPEVVDELILWYPPGYADFVPETHSAERITGRPGRTLTQWAADHAADFGATKRLRDDRGTKGSDDQGGNVDAVGGDHRQPG
jgi:hypothetical protein